MSDMQRPHHQNGGAGTSEQTQDFSYKRGHQMCHHTYPQCPGLFSLSIMFFSVYFTSLETQLRWDSSGTCPLYPPHLGRPQLHLPKAPVPCSPRHQLYLKSHAGCAPPLPRLCEGRWGWGPAHFLWARLDCHR